jgi:protein-tyrosine phosphatase
VKELIDIHSHILPGIDDGAKKMDDSLKMAREAVEQGIHTLFATPHHLNGDYINPKEDIKRHVHQFQRYLQEANIPLHVLTGQETRIHASMVHELKAGVIASLHNTKYVLVEFPPYEVPRYAEKLLFEMQVADYIPIIVHPERNRQITEDPSILFSLVEKGALTQLTAASLIGKFGKKAQQISYQLIEHNLTHFIASDAHNTTSRRFVLQDAYQWIQREFGRDVYFMFLENSQLLLEDQYVYRKEPISIKKKNRFLHIFH